MQAITAAMNSGQEERISFARKQIYENPDRMKAIAEFVVNRLLSLVYGKFVAREKPCLRLALFQLLFNTVKSFVG